MIRQGVAERNEMFVIKKMIKTISRVYKILSKTCVEPEGVQSVNLLRRSCNPPNKHLQFDMKDFRGYSRNVNGSK